MPRSVNAHQASVAVRVWHLLQRYTLPVVLAIGVHAAGVAALWSGFAPASEKVHVTAPEVIQATLVQLQPKAASKPKQSAARPVQRDPAVDARRRQQETQRKQRAQRDKEEQIALQKQREIERQEALAKEQARELAAQQAADEDRRREELLQREREQTLNRLAEDHREQALAQEMNALVEEGNEQAAMGFAGRIRTDVEKHWSRPPSARNGMVATLLINLVPTGDVVSVSVLTGSGDAAFDRSALAAVNKAERFTVPEDSRLFETYFRRFQLRFEPEDLER